MISGTGRKGFSLYELMVSVAILAIGIVTIYESFFIVMNAASRLPAHIESQFFIDEIVWREENMLKTTGYLFPDVEEGNVTSKGRDYRWSRGTHVLNAQEGLYSMDVSFAWKTGGKVIQNFCTAYLRR